MNATVFLSLLSILGFGASAVLLGWRRRSIHLSNGAFFPLAFAIVLYLFIVSSNFLEHSGISGFFDPLEDIAEITFTLVFLFFVNNWRKQRGYERMREQEAWMRVTLESIADGIMTTDSRGHVLQMNRTMEVYTGWRQVEAYGRKTDEVLVFLDKSSRDSVDYRPFDDVLNGQAPRGYPQGIFIRARSGETTLVADKTSAIRNEADELIGAVGIFRDMSRYEALMEQLTHTQKMEAVGQLAGGVAHDLNNMLGGIMGAADVLRLSFDEDGVDRYDKMLAIITDSVKNAGDLTSNLLAFSRKGKIASSPLAIQEAVEKTVAIARRTIDRRIHLEHRCPAEPLTIIGDPSQIQNALLNLIINARDALPGGGTIRISAEPRHLDAEWCGASPFDIDPGEYVRVSVSDDGLGISSEDQIRIFEPFFTTKEEGKGTGLGLAAVYRTVTNHHGAVDLESAPGAGTSFHLYFPMVDENVEMTKIEVDSCETGQGTVLIIEDEPLLRTSTAIILEHGGFHCLQAVDGEEGLAIYQAKMGSIDVVLLDMVMPGMNGTEVFAGLCGLDHQVRVVMTSGFSQQGNLPDGVLGFIQKPFTQNDLLAAIQNAMAVSRR